LYGPGQGSTTGPILWLLCFLLIYRSLSNTVIGMEFLSITRTVILLSKGAAFVDDTGLGSNYPSHTLQNNIAALRMIEQTIVHNLQSLSQEWERLLFSTGGALILNKCFWFLLSWRWTNGIPTIVMKTNTHQHLHLTSRTDSATEEISRIDPHDTFRTLGVKMHSAGWLTAR
jgi:hypothetical protein